MRRLSGTCEVVAGAPSGRSAVDAQGVAGHHVDDRTVDEHGYLPATFDSNHGPFRINGDRDVAASPMQSEAKSLPLCGQARCDADVRSIVPKPGKSLDEARPHAAHIGDVRAVDSVAMRVGDVEVQR